jgi:serine/threonine protein kinase/regulation of enolase protein 1 (concanavalin A-like superfamily)
MGKYELLQKLGSGRFGDVYKALDTTLDREVALKILKPEWSGDTLFVQQFQREAKIAAKIEHPNIVGVYEVGEEDGRWFIAMQYMPGGNLQERLDQFRDSNQAMPILQARKIALDIAQGLSALHHRDLVHCDLKPSNVLFDADGHAHVGDLGLALSYTATRSTMIESNVQHSPGTPAYMSPEQETGMAHLRPPSDIYALGLILFEMLTGRSYKNIEPGTKLSTLRMDAPPDLEALLQRILAKDYSQRPWNGEKAAEALRPERKEPLVDRPPETSQPSRKSLPGWVFFAGVFGLVVLCLLGILVYNLAASQTPPTNLATQAAATLAPAAVEISLPTATTAPTVAPTQTVEAPTAAPAMPTEAPTATTAPPAANIMFQDDFSGNLADNAWQWIDPLGDCAYSLGDHAGQLTIKLNAKNHDFNSGINFNAPRMMRNVSGDFVAETRVRFTPSPEGYMAAGMGVYMDDRNILWDGRASNDVIQSIYFYQGTEVHEKSAPNVSTDTVTLRITRRGNVFTTSGKVDGADWVDIATYDYSGAPQTVQVGLVLINNWTDVPLSADFDYFSLQAP